MPRYHFHTFDGARRADPEGTDLPDLGAARLAAIRLAGAILQDEPHAVGPRTDWRVEVTDPAGRLLFQAVFAVFDAPAVGWNGPRA